MIHKNDKNDNLAERPVVRIPSTLTLKEILVGISVIVSIIFSYGSLSTRLVLVEHAHMSINENMSHIEEEMKDHEREDRLEMLKKQELLESMIRENEKRIRSLEIEGAKKK